MVFTPSLWKGLTEDMWPSQFSYELRSEIRLSRDLPDGPSVKTLPFNARDVGSTPELRFHMPHDQKKQRIKNNTVTFNKRL